MHRQSLGRRRGDALPLHKSAIDPVLRGPHPRPLRDLLHHRLELALVAPAVGHLLAWRPLRKGIADLHRRAAVSQRAHATYLEALAAVDDRTPLRDLLDQVSRRVTYRGRRVRALRIGDAADRALLRAISHGEFAPAGFRNRDLYRLLYPTTAHRTRAERRQLSARISRQLRLLRAHGVIKKVQKRHRYRVTANGHLLTAALFAVRETTLEQLVGTVAA